MDDNEEIKNKIVEALLLPNTIFFIGSGVSAWSDLPNWETLIKDLKDHCETIDDFPQEEIKDIENELNAEELETAADIIKDNLSDNDWLSFWESYDKFNNAQPALLHNELLKFGVTSFITPNYDDLIEKIFIKNNINLKVVRLGDSTGIADISQSDAVNFIFKYHGCINVPIDIVLSKHKYGELIHTQKEYVLKGLSTLLKSRKIVFLGIGFRDRDLDFILEAIKFDGLPTNNHRFAIIAEGDRNAKKLGREGIVQTCFYPKSLDENNKETHENLIPFLNELLSAIDRQNTENITEKLRDVAIEQGALDAARIDANEAFKDIDTKLLGYSYLLNQCSKDQLHSMLSNDEVSTEIVRSRAVIYIYNQYMGETDHMYLGIETPATVAAAKEIEDDFIKMLMEQNDG